MTTTTTTSTTTTAPEYTAPPGFKACDGGPAGLFWAGPHHEGEAWSLMPSWTPVHGLSVDMTTAPDMPMAAALGLADTLKSLERELLPWMLTGDQWAALWENRAVLGDVRALVEWCAGHGVPVGPATPVLARGIVSGHQ